MVKSEDFIATTVIAMPLAILAIAVIISLSKLDGEPVPAKNTTYCEMHEIYLESGGKYGWPDYNENYHEICPSS